MKIPRKIPRFRSFKLAPLAIISVFLFTNLTGIFFSRAFAPVVKASSVAENIPLDIPTSGDADLDLIILRAGEREGIDPRFIHAVIWQESNYDQNARSHAGAQGLMQLMPATARRFGCRNLGDAASNVQAGTKYLSWLLKRFDGNVELALAGYNAGEGAVDKFGGVPPYSETQNYVHIISARYGKTYHPIPSPDAAVRESHLAEEQARVPSGE
jgi:soluble lytic murein transglycosylase-like protein